MLIESINGPLHLVEPDEQRVVNGKVIGMERVSLSLVDRASVLIAMAQNGRLRDQEPVAGQAVNPQTDRGIQRVVEPAAPRVIR